MRAIFKRRLLSVTRVNFIKSVLSLLLKTNFPNVLKLKSIATTVAKKTAVGYPKCK